MSPETDDAARARGRAAWRRTTVQVLFYFALSVGAATVGIVFEYGLGATLGIALAGYLLMHFPLFSVRGRTTLRTDRAREAVEEELAAANNPLTALWFDAADAVEEREDGHARLTAPGTFGVGEQRWDVAVTGEDVLTLTIERNGRPLLDASVAVEERADGTRVTLALHRVRVRPLTVLTVLATRSQYLDHFAAHGYEVVDEERSIGFAPWGAPGARPAGTAEEG